MKTNTNKINQCLERAQHDYKTASQLTQGVFNGLGVMSDCVLIEDCTLNGDMNATRALFMLFNVSVQ